MADFSAYPMAAFSWSDPNVDLENPRFVISIQWTWPTGVWSHFSIVRSTRSPARRREEGQIVMECIGTNWDFLAEYGNTGLPYEGLPVYRDPQPPPGEWVYYTAFVLNEDRVWVEVGYVFDISIADYDWALRLPELLPGVSIGETTRTASPAQQDNDIVQFLQPPGAMLDKVITMGEAAQHFWDPLKVPPQMLRAQVESLGYDYDDSLGIGRTRHVMDALMKGRQGSLEYIRNFAQGAMGGDVITEMSNNLMLTVNDSSFENGTLTDSKWNPSDIANMELREYVNDPSINPTVHPNVVVRWYAYLKTARNYTVAGPTGAANTIKNGIPCRDWTKARMGIHARKPSATAVNLTLGLNLHDEKGVYLRSVTILANQTITGITSWNWYGSPGNSAVDLGTQNFAYAVPWVTVSNPCFVDLLVVDDG